jgi:hypothetical protein
VTHNRCAALCQNADTAVVVMDSGCWRAGAGSHPYGASSVVTHSAANRPVVAITKARSVCDRYVVSASGREVRKLSGERCAGVRKLFRLVQLD